MRPDGTALSKFPPFRKYMALTYLKQGDIIEQNISQSQHQPGNIYSVLRHFHCLKLYDVQPDRQCLSGPQVRSSIMLAKVGSDKEKEIDSRNAHLQSLLAFSSDCRFGSSSWSSKLNYLGHICLAITLDFFKGTRVDIDSCLIQVCNSVNMFSSRLRRSSLWQSIPPGFSEQKSQDYKGTSLSLYVYDCMVEPRRNRYRSIWHRSLGCVRSSLNPYPPNFWSWACQRVQTTWQMVGQTHRSVSYRDACHYREFSKYCQYTSTNSTTVSTLRTFVINKFLDNYLAFWTLVNWCQSFSLQVVRWYFPLSKRWAPKAIRRMSQTQSGRMWRMSCRTALALHLIKCSARTKLES